MSLAWDRVCPGAEPQKTGLSISFMLQAVLGIGAPETRWRSWPWPTSPCPFSVLPSCDLGTCQMCLLRTLRKLI